MIATRPLIALLLLAAAGCGRTKSDPEPTEVAPGNYAQLGPIGLSVDSVRHGKVRMRDMMGRDGESKDDVLVIRTRFKLLDTSTPVKQFGLQRDGSMMGGGALKVKDQTGREFKAVGGFGFDAVTGRRSDAAILTAEKPEATDVLTFDAKAAGADELILALWPKWEERKPDGTWKDLRHDGEFRFRIPKAMWASGK